MLSLTRNQPFGKAVVAATLAATALGGLAATPAHAQYYRGYRHHGGGDGAAVAVGAGLLGLAVGAAIASSDRPHYYYRERVYEPVYYAYPRYYARPYPVYRPYYYREEWRDDWRWHHRPHYYGGYGYGHGWRR
ncbi:MAG: hypothetical protein KGM17_03065 [Sphingomonadales bacterium]|nr:hypothetical protein [Sphingomonadales bacterium]